MTLQIKRAYDEVEESDGYRILVDRIWPRGISKEKLQLDDWMKEIAPSDKLRKWFNHEPAKFDEFKKRYYQELSEAAGLVSSLIKKSQKHKVTLIYGAKDRKHNQAVVLKDYLEEQIERQIE